MSTHPIMYTPISGDELGKILLSRLERAVAGHYRLQQNLSYPLVRVRFDLRIEQPNQADYTASLLSFEIGPDDSPDRLRMSHGIAPKAMVRAEDGQMVDGDGPVPSPEEVTQLQITDTELPPKHKVGAKVHHPDFAEDGTLIIKALEEKGYKVQVEGKGRETFIAYDSNVGRNLEKVTGTR